MSSDSPDENSGYRKLKVSSATSIDWGLVGSNRPAERRGGMYKQLIFCYQNVCVITILMTGFAKLGLLYGGLSTKFHRKVKGSANTMPIYW